MRRKKRGLLLSEHGCPPYIAGYLAHSEGRKRQPPGFLPGHDKQYKAEWCRGWDDLEDKPAKLGADTMNEQLYDVLAVNMETHRVSLMGQNKTARNADAIESMAIMRRGVDDCFFVTVQAGKYKDGDEWDMGQPND